MEDLDALGLVFLNLFSSKSSSIHPNKAEHPTRCTVRFLSKKHCYNRDLYILLNFVKHHRPSSCSKCEITVNYLKDNWFYFCDPSVVSSGIGGRGELSLAEVQCHLDKEGASDLVIDLIMNATSDRIFQESILLAIALLEGGNTVIQVR